MERRDVVDFLKLNEVSQLYKVKTKKITGHIVAFGINERVQMDLLDYQPYKRTNNGNTFILIAIDIFSRRASARALKNKTGPVVEEALRSIIEATSPSIGTIISDNGTEFLNKYVQELLNRFNINHETNEVGDHNALGVVDRFSRTFRERMERHLTLFRTTKWSQYLQKVITDYNGTPHSTLHDYTPNQVYVSTPEDPLFERILSDNLKKYNVDIKTNISVGDKVRKRLTRNIFTKGTKQIWSRQIYTVKHIAKVNAILNDDTKIRLDNILLVDAIKHPIPEAQVNEIPRAQLEEEFHRERDVKKHVPEKYIGDVGVTSEQRQGRREKAKRLAS